MPAARRARASSAPTLIVPCAIMENTSREVPKPTLYIDLYIDSPVNCDQVGVGDSSSLYIDSPVNCDQVGVGDSSSCLGSARPLVSWGVAHHRRSSQARTVDRASSPHLARSGRDESAPPGSPDE